MNFRGFVDSHEMIRIQYFEMDQEYDFLGLLQKNQIESHKT